MSKAMCRALIASVTAALLGVATAAGAHADPEVTPAAVATQYVSDSTAENSNPIKLKPVACPANQKVYGGGARIGPAGSGNGNVMLSTIEPYSNSSGTGFTARATARSGYGGSWSLTVYAICGNALPGWEIRQDTATGTETQWGIASVACLDGKRVIGGGGKITDVDGLATFDRIIPRADSFGNNNLQVISRDDGTDNVLAPSVTVTTVQIGLRPRPAVQDGWRFDGYLVCAT